MRTWLLLPLLLCLACVGCTAADQQWYREYMAYRYSPRYYERTYYSDAHTTYGSAYCRTTCNASHCVTSCDTYPKP